MWPRLTVGVITNGASPVQFRHVAHNGHPAEPRDIWSARRYIDQHLTEHISLTKVANVVGINRTHLSEKFKQVTGVKFVDYIARNRFEKAKEQLGNGASPISEIAFACGFQSLSQFNRVFKRLSGKSPTTYRETCSKRAKRLVAT